MTNTSKTLIQNISYDSGSKNILDTRNWYSSPDINQNTTKKPTLQAELPVATIPKFFQNHQHPIKPAQPNAHRYIRTCFSE